MFTKTLVLVLLVGLVAIPTSALAQDATIVTRTTLYYPDGETYHTGGAGTTYVPTSSEHDTKVHGYPVIEGQTVYVQANNGYWNAIAQYFNGTRTLYAEPFGDYLQNVLYLGYGGMDVPIGNWEGKAGTRSTFAAVTPAITHQSSHTTYFTVAY